jgi:Predicted nucleotide-binding protein containing TIR-like domain
MKPTLFIGSSSESLDIAYAAQKNLEDVAEVVVWTQGIFELTKSYLESLLAALKDTEFGLFIFGADDITKIRGTEMRTARDNVVFELGLFLGRLGQDRSFILMPKGISDFHLPTDLLGIGTATFQAPSRSDRLQAALGPACHDIRRAIRKHLVSTNRPTRNAEKILLRVLIPEPERKHLLNIFHGKTKHYKGGENVRSELRNLRSKGLIRSRPEHTIGELKSEGLYDLADVVELTDLGQQWVETLEHNEEVG